jgi:hypothetical protein
LPHFAHRFVLIVTPSLSPRRYDAPQTGKNWEDKLQKVNTFGTVEDFWRLVNNLAPPSKLPLSSNYHMFKEGVKPAWEDAFNAQGGKWSVLIPRNSNKSDSSWLYSVRVFGPIVGAPSSIERSYPFPFSPGVSNSALLSSQISTRLLFGFLCFMFGLLRLLCARAPRSSAPRLASSRADLCRRCSR